MCVGIDLAKEGLDLGIRSSGECLAFRRDGAGIAALAERLRSAGPALVVLDATGGFEVTVAAGPAGAGLPVAVVDPAQIRAVARAVGRLAKTARLDAEIIARFAEGVRPAARPLPGPEAQAPADLVLRRRQLVEMIGRENYRRRQARSDRLRRGVDRILAARRPNRPPSTATSTTGSGGAPAWRAARNPITSVPGIAPVTARTLIAELPELGTIDRRRPAGFAEGQDRAALTEVRHKPAVRDPYTRLRARRRPSKAALVAAIRKLPTILNAILRDRKPWQDA